MNKTAKKVVATILTTVMTVGAATVVSADDLSITLSHQPYSHALPSYIGEEEGIFEENGLNTEILWFSSGNTQNEALGANEWDAGACGTPPAIAAGIAYNAKIVGFSVDDMYAGTVKPLDEEMVLASVAKTGCAVTAENHSVIGGLGSAVAELLVEKDPVPVKKVGVMDHFGEVGLTPYLKEKYGLTAKDIIAAAKVAIAMKKR